MRSWLKVISALKRLIAEVGSIYPNSTALSGYGESGPYHCEDCKFLVRIDGQPKADENGKGRCTHSVVFADPKVQKDGRLSVVNIYHGCCAFVDQEPHDEDEESEEHEAEEEEHEAS